MKKFNGEMCFFWMLVTAPSNPGDPFSLCFGVFLPRLQCAFPDDLASFLRASYNSVNI